MDFNNFKDEDNMKLFTMLALIYREINDIKNQIRLLLIALVLICAILFKIAIT